MVIYQFLYFIKTCLTVSFYYVTDAFSDAFRDALRLPECRGSHC